MNKLMNKTLILLVITTFVVQTTYADTQAEQSLETAVQPAVAITKSESSIENTTVSPANGVHTGLSPIFNLQTNGNDDDYDFIITSKIETTGGAESAYTNSGAILFGHTLSLPTATDIANAKIGGNNNKNVMAYPVNMNVTYPFTAQYQRNYGVYGDCYVIKVNNGSEGTITHAVGTTPVAGSYGIGQDSAGSYKSTVTFTAFSK